METKTNIKTFDAVSDPRKWREAASKKLNTRSRAERLAYLKSLGERVRRNTAPANRQTRGRGLTLLRSGVLESTLLSLCTHCSLPTRSLRAK